MLNDVEQKFIRLFLEDFPSTDLYSVALSITKHNLTPTDREDAFKIICQHSECAEAILGKRKITKSYLSQFLHKHHVSVIDSWDKHALIRKILEHWNVKRSTINESDPVPYASTSVENSYQVTQNTAVKSENTSQEYYSQLAHQFSEWFYSLINDDDASKLGPEHFFTDSQMKLALQDENFTDVTEASSSTDVAEVLRSVKLKYNFKFLPNLAPNAVRFNADIHGQVMVMVGGTLHSGSSQVVGLFEQMFLLIRDPSDHNNWKIKNSQVILRSSNAAIEAPVPTESMLGICS